MKRCESCEHPAIKGERYCRRHRAKKLKEMETSGYFVETEERTVFQFERQENARTHLRAQDITEEMIDRMDSYRERAAQGVPIAEVP